MGTEFITQKWLFPVPDEKLAEQDPAMGRHGPQLYPEVVQSYYEDTSPANSADDEDSDDDAFGKVDPHAWGKGSSSTSAAATPVPLPGRPTAQLAADVDSTPPQEVSHDLRCA